MTTRLSVSSSAVVRWAKPLRRDDQRVVPRRQGRDPVEPVRVGRRGALGGERRPLTVTSAPGTTAPLASVTVPSMVEVVVCAAAPGASRKRRSRSSAGRSILGMTLTFL